MKKRWHKSARSCARPPLVEKAALYGSRAKGNFKNGSDIDLALYGRDLNLTALHRIEDALDDLLLPYHIDLALASRITSEELLEHIQRVGVVFYERDGSHSFALRGNEAESG